jgi:multiple sugar transport system substrate-binding protein
MTQLEFTTVEQFDESHECLMRLLKRFGQENRIAVKSTTFAWETIWHDLLNVALYRKGADISEIGTTWIPSLVGTNALRPFTIADVNSLGGKNAFLPSVWSDAVLTGSETIWAIPFLSDARVLYYWRDMLDQVGLDPETAFSTPEILIQSLTKLQQVVPHPWGDLVYTHNNNSVYHAATWLWEKGCDYTSPDGKSTAFGQANAITALKSYFGLHRFMDPTGIADTPVVTDRFMNRQTAAFIGGPWFLHSIKQGGLAPHWLRLVGVALPPGPPFIGGLKLVVWSHTLVEQAALDLVRYLTSVQAQAEYAPLTGMLPVRQDAMSAPLYVRDERYGVFFQALRKGRSLLPISLWGLIEERLAATFNRIWDSLFANPDQSVEALLSSQLTPVARRLDLTLKA